MAIFRKSVAAFVLLLGLAAPVGADPIRLPVVYTFSFESAGLTEEYGSPIIPHPSFTFSFTLPDYVTTTGLFALPAPLTIGAETITHFGTNAVGTWIFGNGAYEEISDGGWGIVFDTLAFAFTRPGIDGFITRPTHLTGYTVQGATSYLVEEQLRIIGTGAVAVAPVPEPSTLFLIASGALLAIRRRR